MMWQSMLNNNCILCLCLHSNTFQIPLKTSSLPLSSLAVRSSVSAYFSDCCLN